MSKITIDTSLLRLPSFRTNVSKVVWFCLLRDSDEGGMVKTSACSIAKEIGVCEKTVRNALLELKSDGVIESSNPNTSPNSAPSKVRYMGRVVTLNLSTNCKQKRVKMSEQKSETKSDICSDTITAKTSSNALMFAAPYEFVDPAFKEAFMVWLDYKKTQFKFTYKSDRSLRAAYSEMIKLSGNNPQVAMQIVNQSMSHGWKGLFELKNYGTTQIYTPDNAASRKASRDRMLGLANGIVSQSADRIADLYNGCISDADNR